MDFMLSDADRVLISQVREFGKNYFNNESVAQWRRDMGLPDEVVKAFVDLDFNGFGVIHRRNHVHYDMLAQVLVLEELSRVSGATLLLRVSSHRSRVGARLCAGVRESFANRPHSP